VPFSKGFSIRADRFKKDCDVELNIFVKRRPSIPIPCKNQLPAITESNKNASKVMIFSCPTMALFIDKSYSLHVI
jgi:hypothetical protein